MKKIISAVLTICMVATMLTTLTFSVSADDVKTVLFSESFNWADSTTPTFTYSDVSGAEYNYANAKKGVTRNAVGKFSSGDKFIKYGRDSKVYLKFTPFELTEENKESVLTAKFDAAWDFNYYLCKNGEWRNESAVFGKISFGNASIGHYGAPNNTVSISNYGDLYVSNGIWNTWTVQYYYNTATSSWNYKMLKGSQVLVEDQPVNATSVGQLGIDVACASTNAYDSVIANPTDDNRIDEAGVKNTSVWLANVEIYKVGPADENAPVEPEQPTNQSYQMMFYERFDGPLVSNGAAGKAPNTSWTTSNATSWDKYMLSTKLNEATQLARGSKGSVTDIGVSKYHVVGRNGIITANFPGVNLTNTTNVLAVEWDACYAWSGEVKKSYSSNKFGTSYAGTSSFNVVKLGTQVITEHYGTNNGVIDMFDKKATEMVGDQKWNHYKLTVRYNNTAGNYTLDLYINGALRASNSMSAGMLTNLTVDGALGSKYIQYPNHPSDPKTEAQNSGIGLANLTIVKYQSGNEYTAEDVIIAARSAAEEQVTTPAHLLKDVMPGAKTADDEFYTALNNAETVYVTAVTGGYETVEELNAAKSIALTDLDNALNACKNYDPSAPEPQDPEYILTFVNSGNTIMGVSVAVTAPYTGGAKLYVAKYLSNGMVDKESTKIITLTSTHLSSGGWIDIDDIVLNTGEKASAFMLINGTYKPLAQAITY